VRPAYSAADPYSIVRFFMQNPQAYAFTLPLGAFLLTAMMFASAFKVLSGRGVSWRGRTYR
jgi:hypothetical protein